MKQITVVMGWFIPRPNTDKPAMLVELKCDKDADTAINQLKTNRYRACEVKYPTSGETEERKEFLELVSYLDMKYERVFSVIDIDENNMKKWGRILPFYKNIQEEGIVL